MLTKLNYSPKQLSMIKIAWRHFQLSMHAHSFFFFYFIFNWVHLLKYKSLLACEKFNMIQFVSQADWLLTISFACYSYNSNMHLSLSMQLFYAHNGNIQSVTLVNLIYLYGCVSSSCFLKSTYQAPRISIWYQGPCPFSWTNYVY